MTWCKLQTNILQQSLKQLYEEGEMVWEDKLGRNLKGGEGEFRCTLKVENWEIMHLDAFPPGALSGKPKVDPIPSVVYHQDQHTS